MCVRPTLALCTALVPQTLIWSVCVFFETIKNNISQELANDIAVRERVTNSSNPTSFLYELFCFSGRA